MVQTVGFSDNYNKIFRSNLTIDAPTKGDIVDLQYFLYKEDTARVAALGVTDHSFSSVEVELVPTDYAERSSEFLGQGYSHSQLKARL